MARTPSGAGIVLAETWKTPSVHPAENGCLIHLRAPGGGRLAGPRLPCAVTVTLEQFTAPMAKVGYGTFLIKKLAGKTITVCSFFCAFEVDRWYQ